MKLTKDTTVENIYYGYFCQKENTISTIFNALGWFYTRKWLQKEDAISKVLIDLIGGCLKDLRGGERGTNRATGGLKVEIWLEEDNEISAQLSIKI